MIERLANVTASFSYPSLLETAYIDLTTDLLCFRPPTSASRFALLVDITIRSYNTRNTSTLVQISR